MISTTRAWEVMSEMESELEISRFLDGWTRHDVAAMLSDCDSQGVYLDDDWATELPGYSLPPKSQYVRQVVDVVRGGRE